MSLVGPQLSAGPIGLLETLEEPRDSRLHLSGSSHGGLFWHLLPTGPGAAWCLGSAAGEGSPVSGACRLLGCVNDV